MAWQAIADGVIKATIDHDGGFMRASQSADVYATQQPTAQYHKRITFCSDIHQQAIRVRVDRRTGRASQLCCAWRVCIIRSTRTESDRSRCVWTCVCVCHRQ